MKYNVIGYFLSEGFRNVFKNKKSTFSCLAVMCFTMLMFGAFFAIGQNITNMMDNIEDAQAIQVFSTVGISEEQIQKMKTDIEAIEGVASARLVTPQEAYNNMKEDLGNPEAMEGIEPDVFPPSYIVTLTDLDLNESVQEKIRQIENFDDITSSNETITTLASLGRGIRMVTGVVLVILILISIFIIANTIKLTVYARRKEISIMKYVGATNSFIRTPFMVEGVVIGILSSAISLGLVGAIYNWCAIKLAQVETMQKIGLALMPFDQLFGNILFVFMILGSGLGIIGSAVSMKKYLDV